MDVDDFAPRLSLLLQRAHRLLRGDRQVPRGAPDLGARAARDVRREEPEVVADALPHADRRRLADGAAAAQQRRAHGDRGARRGAGRHAVAAHQLPRRGAGAADARTRCASRCARSRSSPHETGVTNTIDPLGGSYFVESLTDRMEQLAYEYFAKIDELGGMVEAVKRGYPQREIADAAFQLQRGVRLRRAQAGRRELLHRGRRGRDRDPARSTPRSSASRSTASRASAPAATAPPSRPRSPSSRPRPRRTTTTSCRTSSTARAYTPPRARSSKPSRPSSAPTPRPPSSSRPRKVRCPMRKLLVAMLIAAAVGRPRHPGARRDALGQGRRRLLRPQGLGADRHGQEGHQGHLALGRQGDAQRGRHQGPGEVPLLLQELGHLLARRVHAHRHLHDRLHDPPART